MKRYSACVTAMLLISACVVNAANNKPLFSDREILKAVLTAPISQTYAEKDQDVRIYHPGFWTYAVSEDAKQRLSVSIRARGKFRRMNCRLAPLQLNFKKSEVKETLFAGQNKLKLVAPCEPGLSYQDDVILEYLAYRTLELLTDFSYRTRLVRLSYVDSDQKKAPWTSVGFLIEDDKDMAARLGLQNLQLPHVYFRELDQAKSALAELFLLLIANNDYSLLQGPDEEYCCHNVSIVGTEGVEGDYIPIPYDFDMSGLVNAIYAAPPEILPIKFVRTRYYKGLCQPPEVLAAAIAHVQSKYDDIIELFANSSELSEKERKKSLDYVEGFFAILNSQKRIDRGIIGRCRGEDLLKEMQ